MVLKLLSDLILILLYTLACTYAYFTKRSKINDWPENYYFFFRAVKDLRWLAEATYTGEALEYFLTRLFQPVPDTKNNSVVIVLTDGRSDIIRDKTPMTVLCNKGIRVRQYLNVYKYALKVHVSSEMPVLINYNIANYINMWSLICYAMLFYAMLFYTILCYAI